jgi:hypothetical protein
MSLRSGCFIDEAFFPVKSKTSGLGTTLLKHQIIRVYELSNNGLKEFCCVTPLPSLHCAVIV